MGCVGFTIAAQANLQSLLIRALLLQDASGDSELIASSCGCVIRPNYVL